MTPRMFSASARRRSEARRTGAWRIYGRPWPREVWTLTDHQETESGLMLMKDVVDRAVAEPPPLRYTPDDVVEAGRRLQRRRRGWAVSGAAAAVALGVIAVVTVPSLLGRAVAPTGGGEQPAAVFPAVAQPFTFTLDGYRVGKLQVMKPIDVSTAYQLASVYADGLVTNDKAANGSQPSTEPVPTLWAYLTVYTAGAYDPAGLAGAQPA